MAHRSGWHFLQLPGPTNVPERVRRAMSRPVIDHRGPDFAEMSLQIQAGLRRVFGCARHVFIFPSSATGAWEAALVNTLSPGDRVLAFDRGFFARKWARVAGRLGLVVELAEGDWSRGVTGDDVARRLEKDVRHEIRAVLIVHNETSTGVTTAIPPVREALDRSGHPALLMVDAVSSLGATAVRADDWGVDVTVAGSQKGLMLPPGLAFTAVSERALEASEKASLPHAYWSWRDHLDFNERGFFPYTPATTLLYGLAEALAMLEEEGLERVFRRHARHGEATRRAVSAWGLANQSVVPGEHSPAGTTVLVPEGHDAEAVRAVARETCDLSLAKGLGPLEGRAFRIGHLGDFNDLMLAATLSGVEMALHRAGIPHEPGGAQRALDYLKRTEP